MRVGTQSNRIGGRGEIVVQTIDDDAHSKGLNLRGFSRKKSGTVRSQRVNDDAAATPRYRNIGKPSYLVHHDIIQKSRGAISDCGDERVTDYNLSSRDVHYDDARWAGARHAYWYGGHIRGIASVDDPHSAKAVDFHALNISENATITQRNVSLCTSKNRTETRCNCCRIRFETKKARAVQQSYTSPYIRRVQHGKSRPKSCSKHHLQQTTAILIALVGQEIQRGGNPQTPPRHRHKVLPFEPLDTGNDVVLWDVGGIEQRSGAIGGRRPGVIDDAGEA